MVALLKITPSVSLQMIFAILKSYVYKKPLTVKVWQVCVFAVRGFIQFYEAICFYELRNSDTCTRIACNRVNKV